MDLHQQIVPIIVRKVSTLRNHSLKGISINYDGKFEINASGGSFARVTRKTDEDEKDWDTTLNRNGILTPESKPGRLPYVSKASRLTE